MTVIAAISSLILILSLCLLQPANGYDTTGSAHVADCLAEQNTCQKRYHRAWQLVKDNFLYKERLADWDKWEHKYDGKLLTDSQAQKAIACMLESLHDDYTYLRDARATTAGRYEKSANVSTKMLPDGIGYIRIRSLESASVPAETRSAIAGLHKANQYIIDLRNNHGGLIENAYAIYGMLCRKSKFGSFIGRDDGQEYKETLSLKSEALEVNHNGVTCQCGREMDLTGGKPLMILVNADTRSAAEMLSGALQDSGRARLVGERTYGKGVVQDVWDLMDGTSIKVTSAKFYLPSGAPIHGIGLVPDIRVGQSVIYDSALSVTVGLLESRQVAGLNVSKVPLEGL